MSLAGFEEEIIAAVDHLAEAVVTIRVQGPAAEGRRRARVREGAGSGVVVDPSGLVVTNYHVVREAGQVLVRVRDGREFAAELLGADPPTDTAVLRMDAGRVTAATFGDSETLRVGQVVLAMGNSLALPGSPTVSLGVLSAIGRAMPFSQHIWEGLLQTDTAINPGNSGGPLADRRGNVIGLNTAMIPFAQGVGFAIPSNTVAWALGEIRRHGRVVRAHLGVVGVSVTPELAQQQRLPTDHGILVVGVAQGTPAHRAGVRPGDILTRIAGRPVEGMTGLLRELSRGAIGTSVPLAYQRGRTEQWTAVPLEEGPTASEPLGP
jgi:serine protease Do